MTSIPVYLTTFVFGLYIALLIIRLMLGFSRADFYNPISQMIVKATNPILLPLRKIIPTTGKVDSALVILILVLTFIELFLVSQFGGIPVTAPQLILEAIKKSIDFILVVYLFAIIAQVILSWINPASAGPNPAINLLHQITEPVMRFLRGFIPNFGMLDLTPMVAILIIGVLRRALLLIHF